MFPDSRILKADPFRSATAISAKLFLRRVTLEAVEGEGVKKIPKMLEQEEEQEVAEAEDAEQKERGRYI